MSLLVDKCHRLAGGAAAVFGRYLQPTCSTSGAPVVAGCGVQASRGPRWWPQPLNEMSRHRTRPPTYGLWRRSKVNVVDNSKLARESLMHYKLPYIIDVYKPGQWRQKHMPKAHLGDKGEVRRALIVGYYAHETERKHAVCSTDIHNVVLIDKDGNPIGTRILVPVPHALRHLRADTTVAKVLAIATKFV